MTIAQIEIPDSKEKLIVSLLKELGVKVKVEKKSNEAFKKKLKKDLRQAFKEVELHQQGKIELKTLKEALSEL